MDASCRGTLADDERQRRFTALFDAHRVDVVAYCTWRAPSPSDVDDAVSEVFVVAWRRLADIPCDDAARVWLYATARRVIANQRRSRRRLDALRERMAWFAGAQWPHVPATSRDDGLVDKALSMLVPRDREVLLLAEWEDLSADEIAAVMGCRTGAARGRLHRARRRFRLLFEQLCAEGEAGASAVAPGKANA